MCTSQALIDRLGQKGGRGEGAIIEFVGWKGCKDCKHGKALDWDWGDGWARRREEAEWLMMHLRRSE